MELFSISIVDNSQTTVKVLPRSSNQRLEGPTNQQIVYKKCCSYFSKSQSSKRLILPFNCIPQTANHNEDGTPQETNEDGQDILKYNEEGTPQESNEDGQDIQKSQSCEDRNRNDYNQMVWHATILWNGVFH